MSDPIAEPRTRAVPREGIGGAVGVLLGLALIGDAAWLALRPAARPVDAREALARAFEVDELPFGLEPEAASRLADGQLFVSFQSERAQATPGAAELDTAWEPDPPADDGAEVASAPASEAGEVKWGELVPLRRSGPPARVVLVRFPQAEAEAERRRHFTYVGFRSLDELGPTGGRAPLERTSISWHGLDAPCVRERHFRLESGTPSFVDSVRVDLAQPGEAWMLVAIWPPLEAASLEPVMELLSAVGRRNGDPPTRGATTPAAR